MKYKGITMKNAAMLYFCIHILICLVGCETFQNVVDNIKASFDNMAEEDRNRKIEIEKDAENWNLEQLDFAVSVAYLSDMEKNVILEINKVRSDPSKYARLYIKPVEKYYYGNIFGSNL